MAFNAQQWAESHETLDDNRFKTLTDSTNNIWKVLIFIGMTFVAVSGWSLKNQYAQIENQDRVLRAVYGVSNQVQQATVVVSKPVQ